MIDRRSRYAQTRVVELSGPDGETVQLLDLRPLPAARRSVEVTAKPGERLDQLAQRVYRDPTEFWRICDAADCLDPFDLMGAGAPVTIPHKR